MGVDPDRCQRFRLSSGGKCEGDLPFYIRRSKYFASVDVTIFTIDTIDYDDGMTMSHAFQDTFVASASDVAAFSETQALKASSGREQPRVSASAPEQRPPSRGGGR